VESAASSSGEATHAPPATLIQQLREQGVTATFASGDASDDPEFFKQAGESARGALLSCAPASGDFADQYTKEFGQEPGTHSAEGDDLSTIMLRGIDTGDVTRPALLDFVHERQRDNRCDEAAVGDGGPGVLGGSLRASTSASPSMRIADNT
jgi:hypothetical protein